jgi:hypothetical protein
MFGVLRPAAAGTRGAAARFGLVALLACVGVSWTAGASSAFATYGTVKIKKVNEGGDQTDLFHFDAPSAIKAGGFDLKGGETYVNSRVHANTGSYSYLGDYDVSEPASDKYELKSVDCTVDGGYNKPISYGSATRYGNGVKIRVGVDHLVYCVFTNQRNTGTITVKKDLVPATDAGRFDLKVDGSPVATNVGDGGYGKTTVLTGTHTVGESGANLADYVRYTKCVKGAYVVAEGSGDVNVPVGKDDDVVCTIKNVREAQIVVAKSTVPADTATPKSAFSFTESPNGAAFDLTDGASDTRSVEPGKAYTITEADAQALGYKLTAIQCSTGTSDVATRTATVTPAPGETVTCTYTNTKLQPAIQIVKSGPATAYSGDTLDFGFDVTNPGERPLHDVQVTDDHCSPVVGPVSKAGGNDDDILDPGETWHFTCSYVATNVLHVDPNPVTNVAHVQALDDEQTKVQDQDQHDTLFFHPAIDIAKSGPATATAGALLTYTLDVTNPGDMPFAKGDVAVTDAKCAAAPALQSTNGDATPDVLNPADKWTYTCQVQTAAGQTSVVNVADVEGTDQNGKVVTGEDTFTTTLTQPTTPTTTTTTTTTTTPVTTTAATPAPARQVAGVTQSSRPARGTAALRGPRVCPTTRTVKATVSGRQIRRVTFFVRGHKVRTVTKADRNGRFTLTLRTASLRRGANSVVARVEFAAASQTRTRNLRITVTRCAQAVRPQFTG